MRPTYVSALNKPKLLAGIERRAFVISMLFGLLIAASGDGLTQRFAGGCVFAALCALSMRLTRDDPQFLVCYAKAARQKALYDPAKRAPRVRDRFPWFDNDELLIEAQLQAPWLDPDLLETVRARGLTGRVDTVLAASALQKHRV